MGPLQGTITVFDPSVSTSDGNHGPHAGLVTDAIRSVGVPLENILLLNPDVTHPVNFLTDDEWLKSRKETSVVIHPTAWATSTNRRLPLLIAQHNMLVVAAAGNSYTFGNRDLWYPEHSEWKGRPGQWESAFEKFATGKVILAVYVERDHQGRVIPSPNSVRCGLAKEYCYSVRHMRGNRGTSFASSRLGALTFYLFQLWDTPQAVVGVLNECAEDVGEPGLDEEFGRGVVSVVCDTVRNREQRAVSSSVQTSYSASPVLSEMLAPSGIPLHTPAVPVFYALNPYTGTGHVGKQFSIGENDLFLSGGLSPMPLGIRTFLHHGYRVPFMEVGTRHPLYERDGHRFSLLSTYGQGAEDGFSVHAGHLGVRYELTFPSGTFSLHTGYRLANGRLGLPGYRLVGATPVPFTIIAPETSLLLSLGL